MSGSLLVSDGRTVDVRDGLVLGRVAGCDVVIDDTKCSRRHARLVVQGGVVEIEDLQSSNGTLLNGKPVQKRVLRDGDEIQIGQTTLTYREQPAAKAKAEVQTAAPADEVDLFGDDEPAPVPPRTAPARSEPTRSEPTRSEPPAPPPAPRAPATVEFADEVVEVKKARAPTPGTVVGKATATGEPVIAQKGRVLQFSTQKDGGALGDDLAQMSGGMRALLLLGAAALAAGLFWLAMSMMG